MMKARGRIAFGLWLTVLMSAGAAQYQVGQVVTNFTLHSRYAWTNAAGKTFAPGAPMRLSDFAGRIIFVAFFDPT